MKKFVLSAFCAVVFVAVASYAMANDPAPCVPVQPCEPAVAPCESASHPTLAERIAAHHEEILARRAARLSRLTPCEPVTVAPCEQVTVAPCEPVCDDSCSRPTLADRIAAFHAELAARHAAFHAELAARHAAFRAELAARHAARICVSSCPAPCDPPAPTPCEK